MDGFETAMELVKSWVADPELLLEGEVGDRLVTYIDDALAQHRGQAAERPMLRVVKDSEPEGPLPPGTTWAVWYKSPRPAVVLCGPGDHWSGHRVEASRFETTEEAAYRIASREAALRGARLERFTRGDSVE